MYSEQHVPDIVRTTVSQSSANENVFTVKVAIQRESIRIKFVMIGNHFLRGRGWHACTVRRRNAWLHRLSIYIFRIQSKTRIESEKIWQFVWHDHVLHNAVWYNAHAIWCDVMWSAFRTSSVPSLVTDRGAEDFSDCCCVALAPTAVATRNQDPDVPDVHDRMIIICHA